MKRDTRVCNVATSIKNDVQEEASTYCLQNTSCWYKELNKSLVINHTNKFSEELKILIIEYCYGHSKPPSKLRPGQTHKDYGHLVMPFQLAMFKTLPCVTVNWGKIMVLSYNRNESN